ncbi:MAG: patatin-like phospholipase family protein, partial [Bacteroidetes bacterium]|nr:patatin-like phospholipase family protein [Bacteroidota bacterium]
MNGWHSITCGLLVGIAAGLAVARSDAQPFFPDTTASQPTIGLVLSGGSAKGLAHIGVLKVFEEEGIPIDVISGTSMGAIVGGLYSIGYSAHQLEQFTTTVDWDRLFSDRSLRRNQLLEVRNANKGIIVSLPFNRAEIRLPSGILFGQNASMLLTRLTWPYQSVTDFTTLPIPFACVATNLRTGDAVALSGVPLPEAIRTSLSLPSIFAPVEIDGQRYIDGGLARNLPAIDAKNLGATFL